MYDRISFVEESEKSDIAAAVDMYKELKQNVFLDINIEVIHGKMAPMKKNLLCEDFEKNKINILVATTVIEVGIDVPNATIMLLNMLNGLD